AARRGGDADAHRRARALTPAPDLEQPAVLLLAEQGRVVDRDAVVLTGQIEEALVPEVQARAAREAPRPLSRGAPTTPRGHSASCGSWPLSLQPIGRGSPWRPRSSSRRAPCSWSAIRIRSPSASSSCWSASRGRWAAAGAPAARW